MNAVTAHRASRQLWPWLLALACPLAMAQEWTMSGFGTVGYAQSDRDYIYQRFIDSEGTYRRDSKLGAQLDVSWGPQWSATVQAMWRPSVRDDDDDTLQPTWYFGSWRPDNDTLIRVGKQRTSLFLQSENLEVGQTYDFARLPAEVYTLTPTQDVTGLYGSRSWDGAGGEFSIESMYGQSTLWTRSHLRDEADPRFTPLDIHLFSLVGNWRGHQARVRMGWHHGVSRLRDGGSVAVDYPYVATPGFYAVGGPGVPMTDHFTNDVLTLGAEFDLAPAWRVMAEGVRNFQHSMHVAPSTAGGYVAVIHKMGAWSPYASLSRMVSTGSGAHAVAALDATVVPGQDAINYSQRAAADAFPVTYQTSLALGASWAVTSWSKLKVEWLQTQIGARSSMVDSPAGGDPVQHQGVRVWSVNYNFVF